jgi:predicted amidohydrolase
MKKRVAGKQLKKSRKKPIIALAQIRYSGVTRENVEKIKRYIKIAKTRGADIVCFPEACLSIRDRKDVFKLSHQFIKEIEETCKENKIWCIISDDMLIRGKAYSVALVINRGGKDIGGYKKIHLSGDNDLVRAGKRIRVFNTDFGKISIVVCWDLIFAELFKRIKRAGAEIVFCPAQWHYQEESYNKKYKQRDLKLLRALISARAFENFYFVALCNPLTNRKDLVSYSAIASPHKILKEIINKEGIIVSEINFNEIKKMHRLYNV